MKFKTSGIPGDSGGKEVFWGDHQPGCEHCREVSPDSPATFAHACVLGSQLLKEELEKRQAPIEKQKRQEVKAWATKAGVFKIR